MIRKVFLSGVAIVMSITLVLGIEVFMAYNAPRLAGREPLDLRRQVEGATRVVWLGDSLSAGVGASSAERALPLQVAARSETPVDVTSLAVSGATITDVLNEQLPRLRDADRVYLSIGANDTTRRTTRGDFERDYRKVLDALRDREVVVLGLPDMGSPTRIAQPLRAMVGFRGRQLDSVVEDLAREYGATYVDIASATGAAFRSDPDRYFAGDNYHPSDDGYGLWADAVEPVVAIRS